MPKILEKDPCDTSGDLQTNPASCGLETDGDKSVATIGEVSPVADSDRMRRHHETCEALRLDADLVSPEELQQATLTDDHLRQTMLLAWLFKACGVSRRILHGDRLHIVKAIAGEKPQSEAERDALYKAQIARALFFLSASYAQDDEDRAAIHVRNCIELEELGVRLRERFEASRAQHNAKQARGLVTAPRVKSITYKK
jgi:hypothetical protein